MNDDLTEVFKAGAEGPITEALSIAMTTLGETTLKRAEIGRALVAAEQLKRGLVIADDAEAAQVADLVAQVIDAERLLREHARAALEIPKAMERAFKRTVAGVEGTLAFAKDVGNKARVEYQNTLRRRAAEEEARRRQEAEEAAMEAAALAEEGEDVPPPLEIAPVEVPRTVAGGMGKMGIQVRIEPGPVADWAKVPVEWLTLIPLAARVAFMAAVQRGEVQKPEPGESVTYRGVVFTAKEYAVNRR